MPVFERVPGLTRATYAAKRLECADLHVPAPAAENRHNLLLRTTPVFIA
jgi:hypothetical protein